MFTRNVTIAAVISASILSLGGLANAASTKSDQESITSLADFTKKLNADTSVKAKPVTFKNQGLKMAGILFTPAGIDESKKHPTIVVVHPGGGIKEQTASVYAYNMAKQGYVALAFDASHQGASEGEPRQLEDPTKRVEDVRSAVDYATTLPFVDQERIAALGICAGGGYAVAATASDHRIKAVAGVSAVDFGTGVRHGWRNTASVADQIKLSQAVGKQRTAEANGATPLLVNYVPDTVEGVTEPDMVEASEYYRQASRWLHPNSGNRFLNSSFDKLLAFSAFDRIDTLLTQPMLLIAGSDAGSKWQSEKAHKLAKGPKELFIIKGATHMSLYDRDVGKAVPKLTAFFAKNLKSSAK
jgi:fermentation-respiration switch protein FrsA (DUF1100 family)